MCVGGGGGGGVGEGGVGVGELPACLWYKGLTCIPYSGLSLPYWVRSSTPDCVCVCVCVCVCMCVCVCVCRCLHACLRVVHRAIRT